MTPRRLAYLLIILGAILAPCMPVRAQQQQPPADPSTADPSSADSLRRLTMPQGMGLDTADADTLDPFGGETLGDDSLRVSTRGASGQDTAISYSSRDSMKLSINRKLMRLFGDAEVTKGAMHLDAAYIEIDFEKSELLARAVYDSTTKQYIGVPVFKDATQEFSALSIRYNFRTGKGITEAAETRFDDGFYYGERIKRVDERTLFIQDGIYTTCDAPHPHYFFRSERMKVVLDDKIYVDQPTLNVADVPIFFIPIGVFFARSGGKQSGLIIPRWSQTQTRGFTIEGLGYFWAGNEYVDATILTNLYSKGGYALNPSLRFRHREWGIDMADLDYTFGQTRDDPDVPLETSQIIRYFHSQKIGRRSQLGGSLNFSTRNAIRQTSTNADQFDRSDDITTQLMTSNFSYNTTFELGGLLGSFSTQYDRTQNIITDELTQSVPVSLSIPTWTPFARGGSDPGIFDNLAFSYRGTATWQQVRADTLPGGIGFRTNDVKRGVRHSPSISLSLPKIGYFTISPSFNTSGSWFFRRSIREVVGDTIITRTVPQFRQAWTWSAGVNLTTTLYGLIEPRVFGVNAIRHVMQPNISFSYQPDFGDPRYNYFDSVRSPVTGDYIVYSQFEQDASVGILPGRGLQNIVALNLQNTFEAKIAQGDTLDDLKVRLLTLNLSGSYNAAATDYKWSNISLNANTDLGSIGSLSADVLLDPYAVDTNGLNIPELLYDRGEGLVRVRSGGARFDVRFSDQGFGSTLAPSTGTDSVASRRQRFDFAPVPFEEEQFFGDQVRGAGDYRIPWTITVGGSYQVYRAFGDDFTETAALTVGFDLGLTPTARISSSLTYDVINNEIVVPQISFSKDLHCWEMQFDWRPTGVTSGFYFRLGIKAPQLRDIQLERQE